MNFRRSFQLLAAMSGTSFLAGCAAPDSLSSFQDVQQAVESRTGKRVEWVQGTDEDRQVRDSVVKLLNTPLTPDSAVQIALLNNPSLQATFEEIGVSQSEVVQAGLLKNPDFQASLRFPSGPPSGADTEFSVVQDFLDFLIIPLRKRMAAMELQETKLRVGQEALRLASDVKKAVFTLQARQQLLSRLEIISDINRTSSDLAEKQEAAGTLNELEGEIFKVSYTESLAAQDQVKLQITRDRENLNRLLGLAEPQLAWSTASELPAIPPSDVLPAEVESFALPHRLDIAAAQEKVEIIKKALSLKEDTRYLPGGINVGVDTEKQEDQVRLTGPTLELQLPVFDHGQAAIPMLQSQLRQAQKELESVTINAQSEVRESLAGVVANRKMVEAYKNVLLPQRVRILRLSQEQYNFMLKGSYDLLTAKQRELEAEQSYLEAWRDYWVARTDLESAVGGRLPPDGQLKSPSPGKQLLKNDDEKEIK